MSKLIPPTPGRVVWYWPSQQELDAKVFCYEDHAQPLAATVARVWHDRMVNLSIVDQAGAQFRRTSVKLLQDDDDRPHTSEGPFAEWPTAQRLSQDLKELESAAVSAALETLTIEKQAADTSTTEVETKVYTDGTSATGTPPLPDQSPAQQEAAAPAQPATPAPAPVAVKKSKAKA